jgi:uncharacterized protein (TIGR03086 family)
MLTVADGRGLLEEAVRYALSAARHVPPDLLHNPTPCAGWDVHMLLDHLSESVSTLAEGFATGSLGPEPAHAVVKGAGAGDLGTDLVAALQLRCAVLLTACAAAPTGQMIAFGPHDLSASLMSCAGAIEIAAHGWDISAACGSPNPIPSASAVRMLQLAPLLVTDATRADQFGKPVPTPASATAGDRFVAFLGRNPAWPATASPG